MAHRDRSQMTLEAWHDDQTRLTDVGGDVETDQGTTEPATTPRAVDTTTTAPAVTPHGIDEDTIPAVAPRGALDVLRELEAAA